MAVNLRLTPEMTSALRAEADRTGKSQQEILLDAVARRLHLADYDEEPVSVRDRARAAHVVTPARVAYRRVTPQIRLPKGADSPELLDRDCQPAP